MERTVCKKCGKRIKGEPDICPHCGAALANTVSLGAIHAAHAKKKEKKKLTKKQLILRIVIIVVAVLAALVVAAVTFAWAFIETNVNRGSDLGSDVGVNEALPLEGVKNIALFGLDTRGDNDSGRSDAMIILSIDEVHNKVKMTSLARDTLVEVPDLGRKMKLTEVWGTKGGKVSRAVKTINQSFGMNITDYVYVNFHEFSEIIDYLGGITLEVSERERVEMNRLIVDLRDHGFYFETLGQSGVVRVTGGQALAFARIRKIDSDIVRGDRQKEVLQAMFAEVNDLPLTKFPTLVSKILKMCHTNLSSSELMSIATWAMTSSPEFVNYTLPNKDCNPKGGNVSPYGWVYVYDMEVATGLLHQFIYENDAETLGTPASTVNKNNTSAYTSKATTTTTSRTTTTTTTRLSTTAPTTTTRLTTTTSATTTTTTTTVLKTVPTQGSTVPSSTTSSSQAVDAPTSASSAEGSTTSSTTSSTTQPTEGTTVPSSPSDVTTDATETEPPATEATDSDQVPAASNAT